LFSHQAIAGKNYQGDKPPACEVCGKVGEPKCENCHRNYKAWVKKNCAVPGGKEATQGKGLE
jgi:hypothetical protein